MCLYSLCNRDSDSTIHVEIYYFLYKTKVAGDIRKMWMGHELGCNGIEDRLCFASINISLTKWQIWVFQSAPPLSAIYQRLAIDKVNLMSLPLFQFVCDLRNRYHPYPQRLSPPIPPGLARQFNSFGIQWENVTKWSQTTPYQRTCAIFEGILKSLLNVLHTYYISDCISSRISNIVWYLDE